MRFVGRQVDDIEYLYEVFKKDERIKLVPTSIELGFDIGMVDKTIYLESNNIQIFLFQEQAGWNFVLSVDYMKKNVTHWHPRWPEDAIKNLSHILEGEFHLAIRETVLFKKKKMKVIIPTFYNSNNAFYNYNKVLKKVKRNKKYQIISF